MMKSKYDFLIGNKIEELLNKKGIKKQPFAKSLPLDVALFRRLCKGTSRWNTTYLELVTEKLGISVRELLPADNKEKSKNVPMRGENNGLEQKKALSVTLGERIRKAREERGWSVEYLGNGANLSGATISRLENNMQFPREKTLKNLARVLEKPESYFFSSEIEEETRVVKFNHWDYDKNSKHKKGVNLIKDIFNSKNEALIDYVLWNLEHLANLPIPKKLPPPRKKS